MKWLVPLLLLCMAAAPATTQSAEKEKVDQLIADMQKAGAIGEMKLTAHHVEAQVPAKFMRQSFKTKNSLVGAMLKWGEVRDEKCEWIILFDDVDHKEVGKASRKSGLEMK